MNRKLFELALERLRPSEWEYFEELSSGFLTSEFAEIRTMANPSGDGGRDSELFSPSGIATVAVQYSVSELWDSKISRTVTRLKETFHDIAVLIYMTNQAVGAKADKKRAELLTKGIALDLRDKSWFLERFEVDDAKYGAASRLVDIIATPYLEGSEVIQKKRPSLNNQEAKAALVYLGMQWEDESTQKGLTKVAYEALVRGALRGTDSNNRIPRAEIYNKILSFIPSREEKEAKKYIDAALDRLKKKYIRRWEKADEYCLTHQETLRLREKLVEQESEENEFEAIISAYFEVAIQTSLPRINDGDSDTSWEVFAQQWHRHEGARDCARAALSAIAMGEMRDRSWCYSSTLRTMGVECNG